MVYAKFTEEILESGTDLILIILGYEQTNTVSRQYFSEGSTEEGGHILIWLIVGEKRASIQSTRSPWNSRVFVSLIDFLGM